MAKRDHLRSVSEDAIGETQVTDEVPASISDAVQSGSSRDVLASMRRKLAQALDAGEVSSNALASTTKRIEELDASIRRIDAERAAEEAKTNESSAGRRRSFNAAAL